MKPQGMKIAFEWVLTPSKGDDAILTENQYSFYKNQVKDGDVGTIFFDACEIHPTQIVSAIRREASYTKQKYPCMTCDTNGYLLLKKDANGVFEICPDCGGTGLNLK